MKKVFKFLCVAALLAINALGAEVNVYAAANTTYAFPELIKEFNKLHPDAKINLTLGASGGLVTQIQNSAPADIFMAADMGFAQKAYDTGFAVAISIANPETAPYGKASIEALKNAKLYDEVEKNIVYAQKISETLSQALSASDVGFIAASALFSEKMAKYKEGTNYIFVPQELYTPIDQGIVLLKRAENNADAKAFYEFILGEKAKEIFKKFGYNVPAK